MTNMPDPSYSDALTALILKIFARYDFPSISDQFCPIPEKLKARVGFVGDFSSGKSTLINAMLGKKLLPSRIDPTTATIITVEAVEDLESPERFTVESDGQVTPVSAEMFSEIATGQKEGALILNVPPNPTMVPGLQLIDSPGLNSLIGGHSEATLAQLSLLDGLVICLSMALGAVPASILDFLKREEIRELKQRILFVLTFSDEKPDESADKIRDAIEAQLKKAFQPSDALKIVLTNAPASLNGEPQQLAEYLSTFRSAFIDQRKALLAERYKKHLMEIGGLLITALHTYLEGLDFNPADFEKKESDLLLQIEAIKQARIRENQRLEEWYLAFRKALADEAAMFAPRFANAEVNELAEAYAELDSAFKRVAENHLKKYSPGQTLDLGPIPKAQASALLEQLKATAKYVDGAVTLTTLAVTAVVTAGAGASAVAAGEAGGAAAATSAMAKQTVKNAAQQASKSVFREALVKVAMVIKQINPLELVGDFVKRQLNDQELAKQLPQIAGHLADSILLDLQSHLEQSCFGPLATQLAATEDGLRETRAARELSVQELQTKRAGAQKDLQDLVAALRQTS